jgi:superfamily II DNA or RNA helicase
VRLTVDDGIVKKPGDEILLSIIFREEYLGLLSLHLAGPPRRFWPEGESCPVPIVDMGYEADRVEPVPSPGRLLNNLPPDDNWTAMSRRSVARLRAYFLLLEDPQRRLDARKVNTLAHQMSLVRHVLDTPELKRVLLADEVGLGKTVEAGLLIKELLAGNPRLRVLYLAPARLVRNVKSEFKRLDLPFRQWTAIDRETQLEDPLVVASVHKAVHGANKIQILKSGPWDVLVVDECHHLSDWEPGGGKPGDKYKVVSELIRKMDAEARVLFLSGTPHQGHSARFENMLQLLCRPGETTGNLTGRVIYRTKDDVADWEGAPIFPKRQVNPPIVFDAGTQYRQWLRAIHEFFSPYKILDERDAGKRAAGWRCAQALQWAASSPQAGLGYLVRQAVRAGWAFSTRNLQQALGALRPYRGGAVDQPIEDLYNRIYKDIRPQEESAELEDMEESDDLAAKRVVDHKELENLLSLGLSVLKEAGDSKWKLIWDRVLATADDDRVVLFAQPIETVTAFANYLQRVHAEPPAIIMGGQTDEERQKQIDAFWKPNGPRFLVSSRAGGEGINLQVSRRLVHIDVPWNPMELEQRVGRVHRFGSRATILIDTLVMRDSREEEAYAVANEKLRHIMETLVARDRFEELFSRVMTLIPPEELQEALLRHRGENAGVDQEKISQLVQEGFNKWSDFHRRYSAEQKKIRGLDPGLAAWEDVHEFLCEFGGARPVTGFSVLRFLAKDGEIENDPTDAKVLTFDGNEFFACGDYAGSPVFGFGNSTAQQLGLNLPQVAAALRRVAFPWEPCGAAHIRWPKDLALPLGFEPPFGVVILMQQTLRMEQATWSEGPTALLCYLVKPDGEKVPCLGDDRALLLRGIFQATVRTRPEEGTDLQLHVAAAETSLVASLVPSLEERRQQIRYAVQPLLAAVLGAPSRE